VGACAKVGHNFTSLTPSLPGFPTFSRGSQFLTLLRPRDESEAVLEVSRGKQSHLRGSPSKLDMERTPAAASLVSGFTLSNSL
jgi:hypothetical protein